MTYPKSILIFAIFLSLPFSVFTQSEPLDPVLGIFTFGPYFSWFGGGSVGIGVAAGKTGHYFYSSFTTQSFK